MQQQTWRHPGPVLVSSETDQGPQNRRPGASSVCGQRALYRGLLLNTDTKLNKQSRTMFQGWFRSNNPQAKVLTTVPGAAWHQGVVSPMVSPGNQVASWSTQTLPLHAGLCRGGPYTSLANCENNMEKNDLNVTSQEYHTNI